MSSDLSSKRLWRKDNYQLEVVLVAGITILAGILRLYKLGEWSFWIDEIYTLRRAEAFLETNVWDWPVSLVLIEVSTRLLGTSEWSARIAPASVGILSIPVLYVPIKKIFGTTVGLITVLFLAVSPWHIHWSQNARFYTALLLFYNLALFSFFFGVRGRRFEHLFLSLVFLLLASWERLTALFFVPVVTTFLVSTAILARGRQTKTIPKRYVFITAIIFILSALVVLVAQPSAVQSFFKIFVGNPNHSVFRLVASITFSLTLPLVVVALTGALLVLWSRDDKGIFAALGAIVPLALLILMAPFVFTVERYLFLTLPSWAILGAIFVKECLISLRGHKKMLGVGVLILLTGEFFSRDLLYYQYQNGYRPKWREAIAFIQSRKQASDLIATTRPEVVEFYQGDGQGVIWIRRLTEEAVHERGARIWFIEDYTFDATLRKRWIEERSDLVKSFDVQLPGKTMKMSVYLYSPET